MGGVADPELVLILLVHDDATVPWRVVRVRRLDPRQHGHEAHIQRAVRTGVRDDDGGAVVVPDPHLAIENPGRAPDASHKLHVDNACVQPVAGDIRAVVLAA